MDARILLDELTEYCKRKKGGRYEELNAFLEARRAYLQDPSTRNSFFMKSRYEDIYTTLKADVSTRCLSNEKMQDYKKLLSDLEIDL